jgi:hypothetical protein
LSAFYWHSMGKKIAIGLGAAGVALAIVGIRAESGGIRMAGTMGGFILFALGVGTVFDIRPGVESVRDHPEESDTPARVRLLGAAVVLGSLLLPYASSPLGPGEGTSYSFVGLVRALYAGAGVADSFMLLAMMVVVFVGGFIALLHHFGGYLILLGGAGFGYFIMNSTELAATEVIISEFQVGMYVALAGALVIAASSLMSYDAAETDRSFYGSGR